MIVSGCLPLHPVSHLVVATSLPTLSINNVSVTEGNSGTVPAIFTVTLSASSSKTVTVHYASANGSGHTPEDFIAVSGTATIAPGHKTTTITVLVKGDILVEPDDTFYVDLSSPTNAAIAHSRGTGTIKNDDPTPSLSVADEAVVEGNAGTTSAVFSVTLSAPSSTTITVDYTTQDGSASAPSDYVPASGTLIFAPLSTVRTFTVPVNGDTTVEANETFSVNLSSPVNAVLARGVGQGTIINDDLPSISVADVTVAEGNTGTTSAVFTITMSASSASAVTVDYTTSDGTATAGSDYTAQSGTLTFNPGETSKLITVAVTGDSAVETDEVFFVNLSNPTNATIAGNGIGVGTIMNDDSPPALTIVSPNAQNEGNSGTTNFVFTVTLSAPSANTVTVDYTTVDVTATAGSDYTAQSGTLTFNPGETSKPITVAVTGDTMVESDESFLVLLSNPTNATIAGNGIGTGTITNDDTLPTVTIASPAAVTEGNTGTSVNAVFAVTLSVPSANTVTVDYTTVDGSATAGSDYTAQSGTLTYAAGQINQQIVVLVKGDTAVETNETFTVNLSNPTNATIAGSGIGTETINNDDAVPTLAINNVSQAEGSGGGTTNFVFTVTLSAASGLPVTVDFATADGSATAASDYAAQSGTLTFTPGQTTKTITVQVVADNVNETNETFTIGLSNPTNATISSATGTGTIQNDD